MNAELTARLADLARALAARLPHHDGTPLACEVHDAAVELAAAAGGDVETLFDVIVAVRRSDGEGTVVLSVAFTAHDHAWRERRRARWERRNRAA